jgi:hypothetical protein
MRNRASQVQVHTLVCGFAIGVCLLSVTTDAGGVFSFLTGQLPPYAYFGIP